MDQFDDRTLLLRMHAGDEASARLLWSRWGSRVRSYALVLSGSPDQAEDVAQEVFLKVMALTKREVGDIRQVGAWLLRVARNELYNQVRGEGRLRRRQRAAGEESARRTSENAGGDDGCGSSGVVRVSLGDLGLKLSQLPGEQREVLVMKHVACLTFDQMADALDEPRSTVASRYRSALGALQALLEPDGRDGGRGESSEELCEPRAVIRTIGPWSRTHDHQSGDGISGGQSAGGNQSRGRVQP